MALPYTPYTNRPHTGPTLRGTPYSTTPTVLPTSSSAGTGGVASSLRPIPLTPLQQLQNQAQTSGLQAQIRQNELLARGPTGNQLMDQQRQADQQNLNLRAQQLAFEKAQMLASQSNNPLTTTGREMEVSNFGGLAGSPGTRAGGGGTGGTGGVEPRPEINIEEIMRNLPQLPPIPGLPPRTPIPEPVLEVPGAAFARAKDVSGRVGNAAVRALRDLMTRRGMSDSGLEAEGEAGILSGVAQHQAGAEYEAALRDAAIRNQFSQFGYTGGSRERGDDIGYGSTAYNAQLQGRNQNLQTLLALLNLKY